MKDNIILIILLVQLPVFLYAYYVAGKFLKRGIKTLIRIRKINQRRRAPR